MKIVALIGSPRRKGNTDLLVDQIIEGARAGGHFGQKLFLYDYDIRPCVDCRGCKRKDYQCVLDDGMRDIYPLLGEADLIIFGTPVYVAKESALASIFFERCKSFLSHTEAEGKPGESMYGLYRRVRKERGNAPVMPVSRLPKGKTAHIVVTQYQAYPFENVMNLAILIFTLLGTEIGVKWFATECLEPGDLNRRIEAGGLPPEVRV